MKFIMPILRLIQRWRADKRKHDGGGLLNKFEYDTTCIIAHKRSKILVSQECANSFSRSYGTKRRDKYPNSIVDFNNTHILGVHKWTVAAGIYTRTIIQHRRCIF